MGWGGVPTPGVGLRLSLSQIALWEERLGPYGDGETEAREDGAARNAVR